MQAVSQLHHAARAGGCSYLSACAFYVLSLEHVYLRREVIVSNAETTAETAAPARVFHLFYPETCCFYQLTRLILSSKPPSQVTWVMICNNSLAFRCIQV